MTTAVIKGLGMLESSIDDDELSSSDDSILFLLKITVIWPGNMITVIKIEQKDIKGQEKTSVLRCNCFDRVSIINT